jgi:protein-S-isoprenylcysteine O-methyltransferase Ste14
VKIFRIIPPPLTAILLVIIACIFNLFFPSERTFQSNLLFMFLALSGIVIMGWAVMLFRKTHTTLNPNKKPNALVSSGPYKVSRNPMYLGLLLVLTGIAFWSGTFVFFAAPIVFFILIDRVVIPYEEKLVEDTVGSNKFRDYAKKVRRWL